MKFTTDRRYIGGVIAGVGFGLITLDAFHVLFGSDSQPYWLVWLLGFALLLCGNVIAFGTTGEK
jgi:hypothetical protein